MNILENFEIGQLQPNSVEHLHLFVEAKKLALEDRAQYYADMDFASVPLEWLISKEYAKQRAALINPRKARSEVRPGDPPAALARAKTRPPSSFTQNAVSSFETSKPTYSPMVTLLRLPIGSRARDPAP